MNVTHRVALVHVMDHWVLGAANSHRWNATTCNMSQKPSHLFHCVYVYLSRCLMLHLAEVAFLHVPGLSLYSAFEAVFFPYSSISVEFAYITWVFEIDSEHTKTSPCLSKSAK